MKKTTYTYDEVREASIAYFDGDQLAGDVFAGKYALQDLEGNIYERTPADMHKRLAGEFSRIEQRYPNPMSESEICDLLSSWTIVPQGSPMSAIGNPYQVQSLSNCFVIESPHDSYGGILKTDQEQVQIMKRRGGVGFDLSTLRPKGLPAQNAARTTDGIGVFMERYSNTTREVAQGGRRGALMLTISVHHPEILTFINIKRDKLKVTGANISVRVTDEFMHAVKNGEKFQLRFPVEKDVPHSVEEVVDAREIWTNIVSATRDCSEPGILFWDTIKRMSPADAYPNFQTVSTNPCGEITLSCYDSCRLMLINLSKFVVNPFTEDAKFNGKEFEVVVQKSQRLMDDLIDLEIEAVDKILKKIDDDPEPNDVKRVEKELWTKIRNEAVSGRRTGLGITALGDTFAYMNMRYGSAESIDLTHNIYKLLALGSYRSSVTMAKERGTFPAYSYDVECNNPFIQRIMGSDSHLAKEYKRYGRRNIANTTTAPAGSTSILTQTTSGCEPVLFLESTRYRKINSNDQLATIDRVDKKGDKWQAYKLQHPGVSLWSSVTKETDIMLSPYAGSTVEEIDWLKKIDVQAAAQNWICHSISNTTNLPENVSVETVEKLCMHAWETGCKGVTIYRVGSRDAVIVKKDAEKLDQPSEVIETNAPKRPKDLPCDIHRVSVKGEQYVVLVGLLHNKPYEILAGLSQQVEIPKKIKRGTLVKNGKKDGIATYNLAIPLGEDKEDEFILKDVVSMFDNAEHGALTRMISLSMRHGVGMQFLVEQLKKDKHSDLQSFSSVIARVLKAYIKDGTKSTEKICNECGESPLVYQQGCVSCLNCGWSKCS